MTRNASYGTPTRRREPSVSGCLAAGCAASGLACFLLVPSLAYLPAIVAFGLFTLVVWLSAWGATKRWRSLHQRLPVALVLAVVGTAAFWMGAPAWWALAVPFVAATTAWVVQRRTSWGFAAAFSAGYPVIFWL